MENDERSRRFQPQEVKIRGYMTGLVYVNKCHFYGRDCSFCGIAREREREDLPGTLEAATFPKEQCSLPHDAFVSAEVHIFI